MKKNLVLLLFTCFVVFLAAEGLARLFFPQWAPRSGRLTQFWQYDARYGWGNIPGAAGAFRSFGFDSRVTINERGHRGPLIPFARTPGHKRLVIIGDSYVWGYGVNDGEMFTALVPNLLPGAEVVNMSVTGYSTDQELLVYQDEGYRYNADWVVLVFCMNDVLGNIARTMYVSYGKPLFVLDHDQLRLENQPVKGAPLWKRAVVSLAARSYVLNTLYRLFAQARVESEQESQQPPDPGSRFPTSPAELVTARLFLEFQRSVTEKQPAARFLVVLVDDIGSKYSHQIADYLAGAHIDSLVLGNHLDHSDKSLHLPDENHWNPAGNLVVAKTIATYIQGHS